MLAKKGDFVLVNVPRSSTVVHGGRTVTSSWEPGVVTKADRQGNVIKASMGFGVAGTDVHHLPRQIVSVKEIPGGDAATLVQEIRVVTGDDYPSFSSLVEAKAAILEAMKRLRGENPPRSGSVRRRVVASARKQTRRTARGRVVRRRNSPADAKPMRAFTLSNLRVDFFQGYAEHIYYLRESDGRGYQHKVETDAAELYLCDHAEFGHCLLIVDPTGRTPLWK